LFCVVFRILGAHAVSSLRIAPQSADLKPQPGFPLQFLGFAYANPAGFPLQSRLHGRAIILQSKIMTSQDAWASSDFALAKS
jgi:hypothetical protein